MQADLTRVGGPKNGWLLDSAFQECVTCRLALTMAMRCLPIDFRVDIASGKVLFSWNASEHVDIADSYLQVTGASNQSNGERCAVSTRGLLS